MRTPMGVCGFALLSALGACSSSALDAAEDASGGSGGQRERPSAEVTPVRPTLAVPELPDVSDSDRDHDKVDDAFYAASENSALVDVQIILNAPALPSQLAAFEGLGGNVRHVFAAVSYGWTGSLPLASLHSLSTMLTDDLRLIAKPSRVFKRLSENTRSGRVRPVWAAKFAGLTAGESGSPDTTIAIVDTGVDGTHPDLKGRMVGWKDYTQDAGPTARDYDGHGTHVASIALGSGAAFGLGPGTLHYTNTGDLTDVTTPGVYQPAPIHTPSYFGGVAVLSVTTTASWFSGSSGTLFAADATDPTGDLHDFGSAQGTSPLKIASTSTVKSQPYYTDVFAQTDPPSITNFAVANSVANFPEVGDGFNAFRGVAPGCSWYGAKVFTDTGSGDSAAVGEALDDLVSLRITDHIKVVNLSLDGGNAVLSAEANTVVDNGIVVVAAAGNGGPTEPILGFGRAGKVLTIGASNDLNQLTSYTSTGVYTPSAGEDSKPDLLAPGGSDYRSLILAADSNSSDGQSKTFGDVVADDYAPMDGTSMSSGFASGAAALLIDALETSGLSWQYSSNKQPLFVKMLLSASASESNAPREAATGADPVLGRAAALKDAYEGYGLLNPDAAVEAVLLPLASGWSGTVSDAPPARVEWERRAWGRHVALSSGETVTLSLAVPSAADFDLYLYAGSANAVGAPAVRASSTTAAPDADEAITYTSTVDETAYVFVKRVSGVGRFTLTRVTSSDCGVAGSATTANCDAAGADAGGGESGGASGTSVGGSDDGGAAGSNDGSPTATPAGDANASAGCSFSKAGRTARYGFYPWLLVAMAALALQRRR